MTLYRYFDKLDYAHDFLNGKIRLGTASRYRESSEVNGDRTEGAPYIYSKEECMLNKDAMMTLGEFPLGGVIAQLGGLKLGAGVRFELIPSDYYLISFSKNPNLTKFGLFRIEIDADMLARICNGVKDALLAQIRLQFPGEELEIGICSKPVSYKDEFLEKKIEVLDGGLPSNFRELYFEKLFEKPKRLHEDEQEVRAAFFITDLSIERILLTIGSVWIVNLPRVTVEIAPLGGSPVAVDGI
jgi:hypothetical protein